MNPEKINPEDIKPLASFLRALMDGTQNQSPLEEWLVWEKFLEIYPVIARRVDLLPRRTDFVDNCRNWLKRQREYFLQLTDQQLVKDTGSHYFYWLKFQPYDVITIQLDDSKRVREDQGAFGKKASSPEGVFERQEEERLEIESEKEMPPKPKRGRRRKQR